VEKQDPAVTEMGDRLGEACPLLGGGELGPI